ALNFYPGLVGGHCIGVDPYYFIYQAEQLGYHSQIILSGRKINDGMGKFVADNIIKQLVKANKLVKDAKVVILGLTFKENCPDIRNSKVVDIIESLKEYDIDPVVVDPYANNQEAEKEYKISLTDLNIVNNADCLVFAVAHNEFKSLTPSELNRYFSSDDNNENIIIDVKGMLDKKEVIGNKYNYWSL
ncbi:UDP binding domain-containing protein, partial [Priestia megaterium]|uniref:UDP binding domain-containing protein n=1 Tax=Priestia megaterium TaxID=1404 RepID=UPI00300B148A